MKVSCATRFILHLPSRPGKTEKLKDYLILTGLCSYQVFLKLKKLEHSESIQDNSVYDHQWFTVDHYHLAVDLNVSRERIAMLRHDLLTVFQVLNTLELQMVENEYMNWLLDTQLKCNYRPPTKEDPLAEDASTLCQDVNVQLDKFF